MPQASLTAWLRKPSAVTELPSTTAHHESSTAKSEAEQQLPTPPPSSQCSAPDNDETQIPSRKSTKPAGANASEAHRVSSATSSSTTLPPQVEIRKCTKEDISRLKRLNSLLLPIPYPESFYRDTVEDPLINDITLLATWHDDLSMKGKERGRLVGAIRGRLLNRSPADARQDGPMLYLSTLVLLSPYRSHGIATHMLDVLLKRAVKDYGVTCVGAHVWEANADGLGWYRKRGFREMHKEDGYYRRLQPSRAVVVQKEVSVLDYLGR